MNKWVIILLGCLLFFSCNRSLNTAEYVNYVTNKDNGLKKVIEIDGWEYIFQYRPYDFIILSENRNENKPADYTQRMAELKGTAWFNITFKRADDHVTPLRYNISSLDEYQQRQNFFLNAAMHEIRLVYDKDTLQPMSYLFENNYNLTPEETIIVGFLLPGKTDEIKDMQLSYNDQVFKNGIIKATYKSENLNNIPYLKK